MPILVTFIVVGLTEFTIIRAGNKPQIAPVLGGFIMGGFLFAIQEANPSLASKLGFLIVLGALVVNGTSLVNLLSPPATASAVKIVPTPSARKGR